MKTIRFNKKENSNVIDIDDVAEDTSKIYCYVGNNFGNNILRFLNCRRKYEGKNAKYFWIDLYVKLKDSVGGIVGFDTFEQAINKPNNYGYKVLIFDSQCEVLEYAKTL